MSGKMQVELTAREIQVVQALADGLSRDEVGRRLYVTLETVKSHLRKIFLKLSARSHAQAVAECFRQGLIR